MDDRTVRTIVTAAIWVAVVLALRWLLNRAFAAWERRQAETDLAVVARRRTTFSFLSRVLVALVAVIGVWSVLSIFPQTEQIARALLASSAVLALVAGLALNTPLGNLGSGVLVAFTQPLRLGDRVTIGDQTGFVEQINLIYTALVTDDERRIFIPNTQLTTTPIVNRTIRDPRRTITATVPVRLGAPLDRAREVVLAAARSVPGAGQLEIRVTVGDVSDKLVWLTATALAPLDADVAGIASEIRERSLAALGTAELLPSG
ncbi:MAG TPA: mechanosensitive ion channel family protein [Gaiellaceae bacterium]|nr:mechanosensitive ion channel family protein [Gaiellaceae bacterium]